MSGIVNIGGRGWLAAVLLASVAGCAVSQFHDLDGDNLEAVKALGPALDTPVPVPESDAEGDASELPMTDFAARRSARPAVALQNPAGGAVDMTLGMPPKGAAGMPPAPQSLCKNRRRAMNETKNLG